MKKIIYIFFAIALLAFTTCKKDAKLQKLIIGTWEVKTKDRLIVTDYPDLISYKYTFKEDGVVVEEVFCASGVNNVYSSPGIYSPGYSPCTTKYKIENRSLYIEYQVDSAMYDWYEIPIKSLIGNRMVLIETDATGFEWTWTYKKPN
jgi:hypothetical protein